MSARDKTAILVAVIAAIGSIGVAIVTGIFNGSPEESAPAMTQNVSVGNASGPVSVVGAARDVTVIQPGVPTPAPTDPFDIYFLRPGESGIVSTKFTFPYRDIERSADYQAFARILGMLPGSTFDGAKYTVFRVRDERVISQASNISVTENSNMAVLVVPNDYLSLFEDNHQAFTMLLSHVRASR